MGAKKLPEVLKKNLFQPGNPGGPGRAVHWLKAGDIKQVVGEMMKLTRDGLKSRLESPKATMLEIIIGQIIVMAAKNGDPTRMEFILSRVIGKPQEAVIELERETGAPIAETVRPDGSVFRMHLPPLPDPTGIKVG